MSRIKLRSHLMTALRRNWILATVVGLLSVAAADARPLRVEQLPNGSKFSCGNCHHSPYGGPRNALGLAVKKEVACGSACRVLEQYFGSQEFGRGWGQ